MITCPLITSKEWKDLVNSVGETKAYGLWSVYKGDVPEKYYTKVEQSQPIQSVKEGVETESDKIGLEFNQVIKDLEKTYPKGEIDLKEGVVIFESVE